LSVSNKVAYTIIVISGVLYFFLGYHTPRADFAQLIILYAGLFAGYLFLFNSGIDLRIGIAAAIIFRCVLIYMEPGLSDDYFRFIWDGRLLAQGENPYMAVPSSYMLNAAAQVPGLTEDLFSKLNSPDYYSVYPPISQFIFGLSALLFPDDVMGSIVVMRVFIIAAEVAAIFLLVELLKHFTLPARAALIYALNPLVIIELTGNLHFEAIMICFLLFATLLLVRGKYLLAAPFFAVAVGVKLIPLIFVVFLVWRLGIKKVALFVTFVGATIAVLFLPFAEPELIGNFFSSLDLYFRKFEFNASIYYVVRWVGFQVTGYNIIQWAGMWLSVAAILVIIFLAIHERRETWAALPKAMLLALTCYFLFATTVHPWYLTTLVALASVTKFRFAILWSGLAFLSYAGYASGPFHENLWLVGLEYSFVIGFLVYEVRAQINGTKHADLSRSEG